MALLLWFTFILLFPKTPLSSASPSYECQQKIIPVYVSTNVTQLNITVPQNSTVLTGLMTERTSQTSNSSVEVAGPETELFGTYNIWTMLCVPAGFPSNGTLEFAVHGAYYDHLYWNFGGEGSQYNYAEAALLSGHAVFLFDRLGQGGSDKPDGLHVVQAMPGVEVTAALLRYVRTGETGFTFGRIVGVGHSMGSDALVGVVAKYGNVLDAIVLTGFTLYNGGFAAAFAGLGGTIASQADPERWGDLDSAYFTTEGTSNIQLIFYHWPDFDPATLDLDASNKGTSTLGEFFTSPFSSSVPASNYTNPVFVVNGAKDYPTCGGNCYQSPDGSANVLEAAQYFFPASEFSVYITPSAGHCLNMHYSAPETFRVMQEWIGD